MANKYGTENGEIILGTASYDQLYGMGGDDILIGQAEFDELYGGTGNDTLNGGADDDTLIGGEGADVMEGGTGYDLYDVDNIYDKVIEKANEGIDTVRVSLSSYSMTANVENLITNTAVNTWILGNDLSNEISLSNKNDTAYGGAGDDVVYGSVGNDLLYGGNGNDRLYGGVGFDSLAGGANDDSYYLEGWANTKNDKLFEYAGGGFDTIYTEGTAAAGSTGAAGEVHYYTLDAEFEAVYGMGNFAYRFTGNAAGNFLVGGFYADQLNGGAGADTMKGYGGADLYTIDNAGDVIVGEVTDFAQPDTARIEAAVNWTVSTGVELVDIIAGNATITGNAEANTINGSVLNDTVYGMEGHDALSSNGGSDYLSGGEGNDTLRTTISAGNTTLAGGAGDDTFYIANSHDTVLEVLGEGVDTAMLNTNWVMADQVERAFVAIGTGLSVTGNAMANVIYGNFGADSLTGGAGADTIDGGLGADTMAGGAHDDWYVVNSVGDLVVEGAGGGRDVVYAFIDTTLATNVEDLTLSSMALMGTGNAGDNRITGSSANNQLRGMAGEDVLSGGYGADTLYGGAGADDFVFAPSDNGTVLGSYDLVMDFTRGKDKLDLTAFDANPSDAAHNPLTFLGKAAFTLHAGEVRFEVIAGGGAHVMIDINGDGTADSAFDVTNLNFLAASDFLF